MNGSFPAPAANESGVRRNLARIYWLEFRNEFMKNLRMPIFAVASLAFPLMFYILFGMIFGAQPIQGTTTATYMLATFGSFGIIGAALFGFGVGVATERGQGFMILKRASPMPPLAYFCAKLGMALVTGAVTVLLLFVAGMLMGGVRLPFETWAALFLILVACALPFAAIGLAIGYLAGPNSAPIIINILYLPMAFFSGLMMPLEILPQGIQNVAPWLPAYHFSQLALMPLGASRLESAWPSIAALAAYTLVFLVLAVLLYRRDTGKTFG